MTRYITIGVAGVCLAACSTEPAQDVGEQPFMSQQSTTLQGVLRLGTQLDNMTIDGFRFAGATLNGAPLVNLRLEEGELIAEQNQVTLRNTALKHAHLFAEWQKAPPQPQTAVVEYSIDDIIVELPAYDRAPTGNTYLYTISQRVDNTASFQLACPADSDGRRVAIPLADTWDAKGNRNASAPKFTLGCTTGVIAKCYRWGYRPWATGSGTLKQMHQTCTRAARGDYCGLGKSHTHDGAMINIWDNLPSPILTQDPTPPGWMFEAAWDQNGALCVSHGRWAVSGVDIGTECPNKFTPPGQICDTISEALMHGSGLRLFNESAIEPP